AYGLGTENRNMPAYVVLPDPGGWVKGGAPAWGNGYLPAAYQGTVLRGGTSPILHLHPPQSISESQQRRTLDLVNQLNRDHLGGRQGEAELAARIAAYELAFRMQMHATAVGTSRPSPRRRNGFTAWTARRRPSSACAACWPDAWSSAACASCSFTAAT